MKLYHIRGYLRGNRHCAVMVADDAEDAIARAVEQALINPWSSPEIIEVPLPKGYKIIYDPLVGSMAQAELPLDIVETRPEPPHTITRSGIKVYDDWRDNIVVDAEAPPIVWKARDTFGSHTDVAGRPYLASENSEPALSWNLFRSLEKAGRLDIVTDALGLSDEFQLFYWYRAWNQAAPAPEIAPALTRIERRKGSHTEATIIMKGKRYLIMVGAHLGKPKARIRAWERTGRVSAPPAYETPLRTVLKDMSRWEETMRRFYQLLRHMILAQELCRPEVWNLEPHLLAIVNNLNRHASLHSHAEEFARFQQQLSWPAGQTHLLTWQTLLDRVEASFEPAVRPLLDHVKRLSYLQEPSDQRGIGFAAR